MLKIPIILVGNKLDQRSNLSEGNLEGLLTSIFMDYKQVEMGIECSAKGYLNIIDVVYCAQRAVLFPISPLFDSIEKKLKPDYERALQRIFRICDKNHDGYLDDEELADLQTEVFNAELQRKHISALKEVLIHECEEYEERDASRGVTFEAFKSLQKVLIQKMKLQTCWIILRHFGYDDNLQIRASMLNDKSIDLDHLAACKNVELS